MPVNPIVQRAEILLQGHEHPALQLHELLDILHREMDQGLTEETLRTVIGEHPDRLRMLESGPFDPGTTMAGSAPGAWVMAVGAGPPTPGGETPQHLLRETVRWLGCGLDPRSRTDAARWYAIAMAERVTRHALMRREAEQWPRASGRSAKEP